MLVALDPVGIACAFVPATWADPDVGPMNLRLALRQVAKERLLGLAVFTSDDQIPLTRSKTRQSHCNPPIMSIEFRVGLFRIVVLNGSVRFRTKIGGSIELVRLILGGLKTIVSF
jgi:hypothetical protein